MSTSRTYALVIVNPSSGGNAGAQAAPVIQRELEAAGLRVEMLLTQAAGEGRRAVEASAEHDLIVAGGGDGTVREIIQGLNGRLTPVGIVPLGTSNVLAREFGIPRDPATAARLAARGAARPVDVGRTDKGLFLAMCGAGFDAAVVRRFHAQRQGAVSVFSYFGATWDVIRKYDFPPIRVTVDGEEVAVDARAALVSNTRLYGGPFVLAPDAKADDGLLDVCLFRSASAGRYAIEMAASVIGQHRRLPGVSYHQGRRVALTADGEAPFQLDGDPAGALPAQVEIIPGATLLIQPPKG